MIYVASPYSHPDRAVRTSRYDAARRHTARLACEGRLVYSPIVHSHPLAELGLPGDWKFWAKHSRHMLAACREVIVLALPGWQESRGIAAELAIAAELGLPVRFESPAETPVEACRG